MTVLERTRERTARRPLLSLAVLCAVTLALGVALSGTSGVLWVVGGVSRLVFMVAAVVLAVQVVRKAPGKLWVGLVLLVLGGGVVIGILESTPTSKSERSHIQKLEPKAGRYAAATGRTVQGKPHIRGRLVPINLGPRKVDEAVYTRLPNALQARSPKEVSTVVLIRYEKSVYGHYQHGGKAILESARLTIVDLHTHRKYTGQTIDGPTPPYVKRGGGDMSGGAPDPAEIADYLKGLPHQRAR